MALHTMKYSQLNFPALPDFGKIHNYMIIHNVIHLGYFGKLSSFHNEMLNVLTHDIKLVFWGSSERFL